ncbi:non-muscle cofilin 1-like [Pempheris klunzingeri]|uniref:non-muscle cofilin 1-like n=1 Tax=Pempheris klunzingeri TaxID=3127111 RepID=UPI00397EB967
MASGAKVADGVKELLDQMKVVKNDDNQKERIRFVVLYFKNGFIDVENVYREQDLEGEDVFKFFVSLLKPKQCRYVMYDCHFETTETSKKEELVFVLWAPDDSSIKDKLHCASSKGALKDVIKGAKHDLQINDFGECSSRMSFAEKLGKNIIKIEGASVTGV